MSSPEPSLRVRINQIDHTLAQPGALDHSSLHRVPIIRIFGDASTGAKTCVHVHQVYPYYYVEYKGKLSPDTVNRYIAKLTHSLNHAIAISMKRNPHSRSSQFVRAILLVKGVHFYGFDASYSPFLKVLIADPTYVNRSVTILRSGTIMQTRFRVFESHLSYILQFMCDFGLYGCGWINLGEVWQRGGQLEQEDENQHIVRPLFNLSPHFRQSSVPLEVDVSAHQILNRHALTARNIHHRLTVPAPPLPSEPLVQSVRELWEDERRRRMDKGLSPSPELPNLPSEGSRGAGGDWVAETRWWEGIIQKIEREKDHIPKEPPRSWEKWVMTTFESVEALWEKERKTWKPGIIGILGAQTMNPYQSSIAPNVTQQEGDVDIEVDEGLLSSHELSQLVDEEEREWQKTLEEEQILSEGEEDGMVYEDDDYLTSEDGPNPDIRDGDDATEQPPGGHKSSNDEGMSVSDPFLDSSKTKCSNTFDRAWTKLSRVRTKSYTKGVTNSPGRSRTDRSATHSLIKSRKPASLVLASDSSADKQRQTFEMARVTLSSINGHQKGGGSSLDDFSVGGTMESSLSTDRGDVEDVRDGSIASDLEPSFEDDLSGIRLSSEISTVVIDTNLGFKSLSPEFVEQRKSSHDLDDDRVILSDPSSPSSLAFSRISQRKLATHRHRSIYFPNKSNGNCYVYNLLPPSSSGLRTSTDAYSIQDRLYRNPYYSKESDSPENPREFAGLVYHLKGGGGLGILDDWLDSAEDQNDTLTRRATFLSRTAVWGWEFASCPPAIKEVRRWLKFEALEAKAFRAKANSQIEGPTQRNPYGLKITPVKSSDGGGRTRQNMTVLSLEVFAPSQRSRVPDSDSDEIVAVFFAFQYSDRDPTDLDCSSAYEVGAIVVENAQLNYRRLRDMNLEVVSDELELLNRIIDRIGELDPDIIAGWEVQAGSWGYLSARGRHFGLDVGELISRAPAGRFGTGSQQWGMRTTSTFSVIGRHVFNVWRLMRAEYPLNTYTFENFAFHILRKRVPRYTPQTLTEWYHSPVIAHTARVLQYFSDRMCMILDILNEAQVVTKTAEFARIFGVDFFSVISRGSQFKVESFMFRIAKPESFVLLSPSKQDVGKQNAAECMPLIMEPLSAFYSSPLVVLDFQSLYPSIMIAYNYCYSTCLGRVIDFKGQNKFGVSELQHPPGLLERLKDHITVAPNGIMYVKPEVRKGLLGKMLNELLDTRIMVKQAMKGSKSDKALQRVLDARQLSLKYICNVTYGYTSATYSGRMPAVEIADSIVQSGRETLEKAIRLIDCNTKWGAKVVYGDTDSIFIYLRGKTKDEAFRIGHDIAETVTGMNPAPIKLKFEKVYLPCVLMAKKRYVGFKYESPDDKDPLFDAKGIETVRRDGIPAQQKMTETCLKILFRTQDLSEVKEYCCRTWLKILEGKVSIQDFIFAKEVRMGTYSDKVAPPPGATVAARRILDDQNDEPQYGDRIPYVIIRGEPGSRLVDRAVSPEDLFDDRRKHLDAVYYITRVLVPPLERIFNLVGADIRAWYDEMPKASRVDQPDPLMASPSTTGPDETTFSRLRIDEHFRSQQCVRCGGYAVDGVCSECRLTPETTSPELLSRVRTAQIGLVDTHRLCASCTSSAPGEAIRCESLDCAWLFERKRAEDRMEYYYSVVEGLVGEFDMYDQEL